MGITEHIESLRGRQVRLEDQYSIPVVADYQSDHQGEPIMSLLPSGTLVEVMEPNGPKSTRIATIYPDGEPQGHLCPGGRVTGFWCIDNGTLAEVTGWSPSPTGTV